MLGSAGMHAPTLVLLTCINTRLCPCSMQVPRSGGRIVIASDGLWDAVESDRAAKCCRGMPASTAAPQLVKVRGDECGREGMRGIR